MDNTIEIEDVCLYIYMFGHMYVILYLTLSYFYVHWVFNPIKKIIKNYRFTTALLVSSKLSNSSTMSVMTSNSACSSSMSRASYRGGGGGGGPWYSPPPKKFNFLF